MRVAALCRRLSPLSARLSPRRLHSTPRPQTPVPIPVPIAPGPAARAPPLPVTPLCPPPRCPCEPAPAGLDIDRTTPLSGTAANYHRHLLISTGKSDWASKIEFDAGPAEPGGLAAKVKAVASLKGGNLRDPFAPTLITNSSFAAPGAYVFPSGVHIAHIAPTTAAITALIRGFLLPRAASAAPAGFEVRSVRETVVLICSHMSRDVRCGTLAPLLRTQFETVLAARDVLLTPEHEARGAYEGRVKVGFTSHLSGHKFAGNVIVYLPGSAEEPGLGVWYGRVEPRHVEGIVEETVLGRRVIAELCRGIVEGGQGGQGGQDGGGAGGRAEREPVAYIAGLACT